LIFEFTVGIKNSEITGIVLCRSATRTT